MNRQHSSSMLVAALSSAFGVALLAITGILTQVIGADAVAGRSDTVKFVLTFIAWVFIAIAVYVGSVVTANTFATIVAGRARTIALYRLIGSSAAAQRRSVAREGFIVGIVGGVIGAIVGILLTVVLVTVGVATTFLPDLSYNYLSASAALPIIAVVLTTWAASWVGSRRVLTVSPMQATGAAHEQSVDQAASHSAKNITGLVLFIVGDVILVFGMFVGLISALGVLIGVFGGLLSFTGVVLAANAVMPRALRVIGYLFGRGATARLAAENAVRYPERSTRTTIGLVIGVTLVTTFAVTVASFEEIVHKAQSAQPGVYEGVDNTLAIVVTVFSILMGFSALIAAVGMVNNLSLNVVQRTRELGLLRALGFTARQIRSMILIEGAQLTIAAVAVGLVLGTFYGWAGAQSLVGSITGSPGIATPVVPLALIGLLVMAAAVLTAVASVAPARRATRVTPVVALAID